MMITQPNMNLLSALAPASPVPAAPVHSLGAQNLRFDAALSLAAKSVLDSDGALAETTLNTKVGPALESLLSQLAQKSADPLRQGASQPDLLKPAIESVAQAQGLNPEETAVLKELAPLAVQRLAQALDSLTVENSNTANLEQPGKISGPQGGEPGKTVDPATPFKPQPTAQASSPAEPQKTQAPVEQEAKTAAPFKALKDDERSTPNTTTLAQAAAWVPTLVSTRTDSGGSQDSAVSLATGSVAPAASPAPVALKVSTLQAPSPAPASATASPAAAPKVEAAGPAAVPETSAASTPAQAQTPVVSVESPRPQAAVAQAPAETLPQLVSQPQDSATPAQAKPVSKQAPQAPAAPAAKAPAQPKSAAEISLDFKVALSKPTDQATPIQDGTLFVLKGDGSTQGTAQVVAAPAQAVVSTEPVAVPAITAAPLQASKPAAAPESPAPTESIKAGAPFALGEAPNDLSTLEAAVAASKQGPGQTAAPAQAPEAQPAAQAALFQPSQSEPKAKATSEASTSPLGLEKSAGFKALQRGSQSDAPESGMAFGQETLRHLVTQVARELGVREAAFTQVSQAVVDAAGKENSRLTVKLKPANLGEVQVDLSVVGGKLTAKLLASTPEVRDAFVRDLPAFKAGLEAQGLLLDQVSVAVRSEAGFNQQQQPQPQAQPQDVWGAARAQAGTEPSSVFASAAWGLPALNDQLFSALA